MVKIQKKYIEKLDSPFLKEYFNDFIDIKECKLNEPLIIEDSIIDLFDLSAFNFYSDVIIQNCIIKEFKISYALFYNGLSFSNNVVFNDVEYECGGRNKSLFIIEKSVFYGFLNISYCDFEDVVYFNDNCLFKGSNILGNQNKGYVNKFNFGIFAERNIGKIDLDDENVDRIWPTA